MDPPPPPPMSHRVTHFHYPPPPLRVYVCVRLIDTKISKEEYQPVYLAQEEYEPDYSEEYESDNSAQEEPAEPDNPAIEKRIFDYLLALTKFIVTNSVFPQSSNDLIRPISGL
jgi:hypothetical protein